ncbi:TIGR03086 family metal-binding protein [Catellatospora sp. KI3]|uniref:TIGR03086 family metal-binding protein n=1 Tax=Catellatospora sp. KI3 TaxID=3041620 RepID=UPI002482AF7F|nr:TIGR03086 family metal-binding protein [Catellatospora sp. KI3]MDI1462649.1 TIGR03086 family metal-binding protein [Catellatospora sp. KI3]
MIDMKPAAYEVVRLLDGVTPELMANPTPCPEFPVAALLDHIMGLTIAFKLAAEKATPPGGADSKRGSGSADTLDPAWREILPQRLDEMVAAWSDPAAWQGMTQAGGQTLPAEMMGVAALDELVLHGWDLARATGQQFSCDPASSGAVFAFTEATTRPEYTEMRVGLFGPVVDVPADAPEFDRALGFAGRDPRWSPSQA